VLLQQTFQEADGNLAEFCESLAKQRHLLALVAGRPMGRVHTCGRMMSVICCSHLIDNHNALW
jgi:hypothetical protein